MNLPHEMQYVDHGAGGGPEVMHIRHGPVPQPAAGEVLLKVAFAGINRPDCLQRLGRYAPPPGASPVMGLEVAGTVVALGAGANDTTRVGELRCALVNGGGYAEYCSVPAAQTMPIPQGLDLLQAAALPENFFTVWTNVFERGGLQKGERFLVHGGSSGIGLTAIQMARSWGAEVYCTVGSEAKAQACRAAGAHHAFNYQTQDFVTEVQQLTQHQGLNLILDMVGGSYIQKNLNLLALQGRLVQIAFLQQSRVEVDWLPLMTKRLMFTGSTLRPRSSAEKAAIAMALRQHIWPLLERGSIKPYIHQVFDLNEVSQAHALMESSAHIGKIMLRVASDV